MFKIHFQKVIYNFRSLNEDGVLINNVTLIAGLDGRTGKTLWAKQFNFTLFYGSRIQFVTLTSDIEDKIWAIFAALKGGAYSTALLKFDKNGNLLNQLIIGNITSDGSQNLFYIETMDIRFTA